MVGAQQQVLLQQGFQFVFRLDLEDRVVFWELLPTDGSNVPSLGEWWPYKAEFRRVPEFWKSSGILETHFPDLESSGILSRVLESSGKLDNYEIYLNVLFFMYTYVNAVCS